MSTAGRYSHKFNIPRKVVRREIKAVRMKLRRHKRESAKLAVFY